MTEAFVSAGAAAPHEFYDAYTVDVEARSVWARARRRFLRHRLAVASLVVLTFVLAAGFLARYLAPYPYMRPNVNALSLAPTWAHPFGTDLYGRDYFSSVLYALGTEARVVLFVGLIGTLIGVTVGVVAGYFAGAVDTALMRFTDLLLTLPAFVVVIVAAAYLHATSPLTVAVVLASLLWMPAARVVRGTSLSLREKEYVEAARAMGAGDLRIMVRHILPNAIGSVAVAVTLMIAGAIMLEVTLSYLGFGIADFTAGAPKRTPSLGHVMAQANDEGLFHWWGLTFPGLAIVLIVMSINFIGDGLRDALDPGQRSVPGRSGGN